MTERQLRKLPKDHGAAQGADASAALPIEPATPESRTDNAQSTPARLRPGPQATENASGEGRGALPARTRTQDELLALGRSGAESCLTLTEVAVLIGSQTGRRPSSSTCWRWALKGVRGKKLEVIRVGGTLYTTWGSVQAFLNDQPSSAPAGMLPSPSKPARICAASQVAAERRQREREAAKRHLDEVCFPRRDKPR